MKSCVDKKTKEPFAVKIITKDKVKGTDQSKLQKEIAIMKQVHHPNCVEFKEMYESRSKIYIVMELVTGGELFERVIKKEHYSEMEAARCFQQVCDAIDDCNQMALKWCCFTRFAPRPLQHADSPPKLFLVDLL